MINDYANNYTHTIIVVTCQCTSSASENLVAQNIAKACLPATSNSRTCRISQCPSLQLEVRCRTLFVTDQTPRSGHHHCHPSRHLHPSTHRHLSCHHCRRLHQYHLVLKVASLQCHERWCLASLSLDFPHAPSRRMVH